MEFQLGVNTSRVMHYTYELVFIKSYIHKSAHASENNNVFCTSKSPFSGNFGSYNYNYISS